MPRRRTWPSLPARAALATLALLVLAGCVSRKVTPVSAPGELRIVSLTADPDTIFINQQSVLTAEVDNPSGAPLSYSWSAYQGSVVGEGPSARYFGAYCCAGTDWVILQVRNDRGEQDTKLVVLAVYQTEL